jgi:hypothetical protein
VSIKGARFWNDRDHYYTQTNNPTEEILRKRSDGNWLVSCGPSAAVSCLSAMGHDVAVKCPGSYAPQPEESSWTSSTTRGTTTRSASPARRPTRRTGTGTRFPVLPGRGPGRIRRPRGLLLVQRYRPGGREPARGEGRPAVPGQAGPLVAAVAWDEEARELIFNDPWPGRFADKDGFNRRMWGSGVPREREAVRDRVWRQNRCVRRPNIAERLYTRERP